MHFQQCVSKPFAVTHRACKHTLCIYCSEKSKVSILVVSLEAVVEGWEEATTLTLARVSPCCLGLGLCVLRADFLRQLAHGGEGLSHLALDFSHATPVLGLPLFPPKTK